MKKFEGDAPPRGRNMVGSSEKCASGGYNSTSRSPRLLDQTAKLHRTCFA